MPAHAEIPRLYYPVLRRLREQNQPLSYSPECNLIYLLEDLPLGETVFTIYHECAHGTVMNGTLGYILDTLAIIQALVARVALHTLTETVNFSVPENMTLDDTIAFVEDESPGFFDLRRRQLSPKERRITEIRRSPQRLAQLDEVHRSSLWRHAKAAFIELGRRKKVLIDEWRFAHEGFATLVELTGLTDQARLAEDLGLWSELLDVPYNHGSTVRSFRSRLSLWEDVCLREKPLRATPAALLRDRGKELDIYRDGLHFFFHYFVKQQDFLQPADALAIASQVPYHLFPDLDSAYIDFELVARNVCSPTTRIARLADALEQGKLRRGMSDAELLACAGGELLDPDQRPPSGYYQWEIEKIWRSSILRNVLGDTDEALEAYTRAKAPDAGFEPWPHGNDTWVWIIFGKRAFCCQLRPDVGAIPRVWGLEEEKMLLHRLDDMFVTQAMHGHLVLEHELLSDK